MKYLIFEIQATDTSVAVLPCIYKEDRNEADSTYYSILAAAAISLVPTHTVMLTTDEGRTIMSKCYKHRTEPEASTTEATDTE